MAELGSGSGSEYPGTLDTYNTQVANNVDDYDAAHMNDVNQAVIAIQGELGTDPAGSLATVAARIGAEHNPPGTHSTITSTSVTTGVLAADNITIDANAITSTDTNGDITITPDGTGDLVLDGVNWPQADGSANQSQRTNGSAQLSYGNFGRMDLLATATPSAAATADFTSIGSAYHTLLVVMTEIIVSTDDVELELLLDYGAGFLATGYAGALNTFNELNTASNTAWSATEALIGGSTTGGLGVGSGAGESVLGGTVTIYSANVTSHTAITSDVHYVNGEQLWGRCHGAQETDGVVDGIRLQPSAGTFSGTIKLYGIL